VLARFQTVPPASGRRFCLAGASEKAISGLAPDQLKGGLQRRASSWRSYNGRPFRLTSGLRCYADLAWAKLRTLVEGARLASRSLLP